MKKPVLTLFLTEGMSLKRWDELGLLNREMAIYVRLQHYFTLQIYSWGTVSDLNYEAVFPGMRVLIIPYYERHVTWKNRFHRLKALFALRQSAILKTNQILGSDRAAFYSRKFNIPMVTRCGYLHSVFTEHQSENTTEIAHATTLEKQAFEHARIGFTSTERDRREVLRRYSIPVEKVITLPNYVDRSVFFPPEKPRETGHVLFIGRLSEQKNLFNLLDAFEQSVHATKLTLIGAGPLESRLKEHASALKKSVSFMGALPNAALADWLKRCSIYVLPSLYEGLPKTLLEAMSSGCPCVATRVEGIDDVLEHRKTGFLTGTDAGSLASGLDAVLSDTEFANDLGKHAAERIQLHYSLDHVSALEIGVYRTILAEHGIAL